MRPRLQFLAPDLVDRIVDEAIAVLGRQGVRVEDPAAFGLFESLGLEGHGGDRLTFPEAHVRDAIAQAPGAIDLYTRDGDHHARLEGDRTHVVPSSSALRIVDWRTDVLRPAVTADLIAYARVADGLPQLDYLSTAFLTGDVPPVVADAWRTLCVWSQSPQPLVSGAFTSHGVERMARLQCLFRDGRADLVARPMSIFTVCPNTPLRWGEDPVRNLIDCAEWGIPIEIVPVLLLGMISPATTVGALVLHTAEVLSGLTLAQLVRPGAPVIFGGAPATFHMRYMTNPMTAAEALQVFCGYAAIADRLGLPSQGYMGLSDSKFHDAQAGAETGIGLLLAHQVGMNSVSGPGMLDYVNAFSLEKLVFDDELVAYVRRILEPVDVREDLPTGPLIDELLAENHLLTSPHTLAHWPETFLMPGPVWDRTNRDQWADRGEHRLRARAVEAIEEALDDYDRDPLDPALLAEARALLAADADGAELPALEA